ncbi:MAG: class I SAM-dependent methyltransferase [Candidatus Sericytochromatia bacterium]
MEQYNTYSEIKSKVDLVEGYLVEGEDRVLFEKAKELKDNSIIIEIGSFKGKSSVAMGYACVGTNKKIYCIDPWISETYFKNTKHENEDIYNIWLKNIKDNDLENYVIPIKEYSTNILPNWKITHDLQADLIFIDGDHSFKGVTDDFVVSYPHLKEGGLIIFQDIATYFEGCEEFWYNIASKKLIDHGYFNSLSYGRKPLLIDTIEYKNILEFLSLNKLDLALLYLNNLQNDYPYSLNLEVLKAIIYYKNNDISNSKYIVTKLFEKYTYDDLVDIFYEYSNDNNYINEIISIFDLSKKLDFINIKKAKNLNNILKEKLNVNCVKYLISFLVINNEKDSFYLNKTIESLVNNKYSYLYQIKIISFFDFDSNFINILANNYDIEIIKSDNIVSSLNKAIKDSNSKYIKIMDEKEHISDNFIVNILKSFYNTLSPIIYYDFYSANIDFKEVVEDKLLTNILNYFNNNSGAIYYDSNEEGRDLKTIIDNKLKLKKIIFSDYETVNSFLNPKKIYYNFVWEKKLNDIYGELNENLKFSFLNYFFIDLLLKNISISKSNDSITIYYQFNQINPFLNTIKYYFLHNRNNEQFFNSLDELEKELFLTTNKLKDERYNHKNKLDKYNNDVYNYYLSNFFIIDNKYFLDFDFYNQKNKHLIYILKDKNIDDDLIEKINYNIDIVITDKIDDFKHLNLDFDKIYDINNINIVGLLDEVTKNEPFRFNIESNIENCLKESEIFYKENNFKKVINELEKLIKYTSKNHKLYYLIGMAYFNLKEYSLALDFLSISFELEETEEIREKIILCMDILNIN